MQSIDLQFSKFNTFWAGIMLDLEKADRIYSLIFKHADN